MKNLLSILFLSVLLQFNAWGQDDKITVKGTVVEDESEVPVPGVNIVEEGTSNGTTTDFDGNFEFEVSADAHLKFSSLGYVTQKIPLDGQTELKIKLKQETSKLAEVIVVGYGEQKKADLTTAVSQIKGEDVKKSPVANVSNALAGKLPGLKVTQSSGEPGYNQASINLRGFGNPLVIVDGVPRDYNSVDPSTIKSVSVIKDASAAVYGVRAANGVIEITTKEGKKGKPKINISGYTGWQVPARYPDFINAGEYAELKDESAINQGRNPIYGPDELEKYRNEEEGYKSTNWYDEVIKDASPQDYVNMNVSGGTDKITYFFSGGYLRQEGMWKSGDTQYERFNISSNIKAEITDNLTASLNLSGRLENRNYPGAGSAQIMTGIVRNAPTFSPYADPAHNYFAETNVPSYNSVMMMNKDYSGYTRDRRKVFDGQLGLEYTIPGLEELSFSFNYAYGTNVKRNKSWTKKYQLYDYFDDEDEGPGEPSYVGNDPSKLDESYETGYTEDGVPGNYNQMQVSVDYEHTFGEDHNVKGKLLFETLENKGDNFSAYREYLLNLDYLFAGIDENKDNDGSAFETATAGLVGRFNYNYKKKYYLEAGFRYDGSSKFGAGHRWGFFPFVSGGWTLTKEDFLKEPLNFFDNLKLRASWGELGDDSASDFQFVTGYNYPSSSYIFGHSVLPGLVNRGLANPGISWFKATTTDIGLDATFFDHQIEFTFDWFYRKRTGLLATRATSLPGTFGSSLPQENLNSDNTRGIDLSVSYNTTIANDLKVNLTGNYGFSRSRNQYVEHSAYANSLNQWREDQTGRNTNVTWGYKSIGQFQSQEEINNWAIQDDKGNTTLRPGDIKYLDYNGDGVINDDDQIPIGKGETPEITYGFDLSLQYKGFDLSASFQGAANVTAYFDGELQNPFYNGANTISAMTDRWHREDLYDPNSDWIPGKYPSTQADGNPNNRKSSSYWLKDASYLRLKNLEIGYSLPESILDKFGIDQWRIYVSAHNLITWDSLDFMDPEAPTGRGWYYPQQKIVNVGFNLTL